jgi:cytidine deaminase
MKEKLFELLNNSYAPYSNYKVSACVVMNDGNTFYGVNVENASYGATMCAERVAIYAAITNGYKKNDFKHLYLVNNLNKISYPCFMCRQVISEFFDNNSEITILTTNEEVNLKVSDLITYPFNRDDLK